MARKQQQQHKHKSSTNSDSTAGATRESSRKVPTAGGSSAGQPPTRGLPAVQPVNPVDLPTGEQPADRAPTRDSPAKGSAGGKSYKAAESSKGNRAKNSKGKGSTRSKGQGSKNSNDGKDAGRAPPTIKIPFVAKEKPPKEGRYATAANRMLFLEDIARAKAKIKDLDKKHSTGKAFVPRDCVPLAGDVCWYRITIAIDEYENYKKTLEPVLGFLDNFAEAILQSTSANAQDAAGILPAVERIFGKMPRKQQDALKKQSSTSFGYWMKLCLMDVVNAANGVNVANGVNAANGDSAALKLQRLIEFSEAAYNYVIYAMEHLKMAEYWTGTHASERFRYQLSERSDKVHDRMGQELRERERAASSRWIEITSRVEVLNKLLGSLHRANTVLAKV